MSKYNENSEETKLVSTSVISRIAKYSSDIRIILLINSILLIIAVTATLVISGLLPVSYKDDHKKEKNHFDLDLKYTFDKTNGGHTFVVQKIATIGNSMIASAGYDSTVKVWNINNGTLKFNFDLSNQTTYINNVAGIGKDYLASASWDYAIRIWDVNNGTLKYVFNKTNGGHIYYVWVLAPIGTDLLASGGGEGWVKIWDLKNGVLKYTFGQFDNQQVRDLAVMSNNILASGGDDENVKLWDYSTGLLIHIFNRTNGGHSSPVTTLARLNNNLLASGAKDGSLRIWDVNARVLINSFDYNNGAHSNGITSLAWIGNNLFASGASDGEIKVWDFGSQDMLKYTFDWTTNSHKDIINSMTSFADGDFLITGSMDTTIKIWNVKTGTLIKTLDSKNGGHSWYVETVVQVARNIFASCGNDNNIKVWELNN
jgi:WD40 repeat protein